MTTTTIYPTPGTTAGATDVDLTLAASPGDTSRVLVDGAVAGAVVHLGGQFTPYMNGRKGAPALTEGGAARWIAREVIRERLAAKAL